MVAIANRIVEYTKEVAYNGTIGAVEGLRQVGWINGMYKVYSMQGFEKLSKSVLATFGLASQFCNVKIFGDLIKAFDSQRAVIYGVMSIDNLAKFLQRDGNGRVKIVIPEITELLSVIGSFFETGKFLQRQEVFKFESCSALANSLGKWEIFGEKPFTYRPFTAFCDKPKEFFIFISCIIDLGRTTVNFFRPSGDTPETKDANRLKELGTGNVLKQVGNMGKLYLIWNGTTSHTRSFAIVNFVTQNASLLAFLIKNNFKKA
ncbi:MAG: hypothetical protein H0W88_07975 [Parachlamydiaceae bacterium]|nr:hypothetical protein [Parachlamydiaceae bacterium]